MALEALGAVIAMGVGAEVAAVILFSTTLLFHFFRSREDIPT